MARVIHRALFEKVATLPEWQRFCKDFETICGIPLLLVDELGRTAGGNSPGVSGPVCRMMAECEPGRRYCQLFRQRLLAGATSGPETRLCDAGMEETAVPLRIAGLLVGYLVFAGYRPESAGERQVRRARHLLDKAGIHLTHEVLSAAMRESGEIPPQRSHALARIANTAADLIAAHLAPIAVRPDRALPGMVERACRLIRRNALVGPVRLGEVADEIGVSAGHLSRAFHQHTGMTFSEYVTRLRVDHAREMLRDPRRDISSIALDCGFGSISQFNRSFRTVCGATPVQVRRRETATASRS